MKTVTASVVALNVELAEQNQKTLNRNEEVANTRR